MPRMLHALCLSIGSLFALCATSRYSGLAEEGDVVMLKTKIKFTWRLLAGDMDESCEVVLLCNDAARGGVHLPKQWKIGKGLDTFAQDATRRRRAELFLSGDVKFDCRLPPAYTIIRVLLIVHELNILNERVCLVCVTGTLASAAVLHRGTAI